MKPKLILTTIPLIISTIICNIQELLPRLTQEETLNLAPTISTPTVNLLSPDEKETEVTPIKTPDYSDPLIQQCQQKGSGTVYLPFVNSSKSSILSTQNYTPTYVINFLHPELGCSYLGIAGQIFDLAGKPITGKVVEITGIVNNIQILFLGITGTAPSIGPGGFELKIADKPFDSQNSVFIQVFDIDGEPLSERISIQTFEDCNRNLIIINFKVSTAILDNKNYIPVVIKKR